MGCLKQGDDHIISYDHFPRINIAMMNATNGCRWSFVTQFLFNQLGIELSYLNWISLARIPSFEDCVLDHWFGNSCKYSGGLRPRCWYGLPVYHHFHGIFSNFCTGISVSSQDTKSWEASMRCWPLGEPHAEMLVWNTDGVPVVWICLNRWK